MTKRKLLYASSFFNLLLLAFIAYSTYQLKVSLDLGAGIAGFAARTTVVKVPDIYVIFVSMTGVLLLSLIVKHAAMNLERNIITFAALLCDSIVAGFLVALTYKSLMAAFTGAYLSYILELVLVGCSVLMIIIDLLSYPAEQWGRLTFKL